MSVGCHFKLLAVSKLLPLPDVPVWPGSGQVSHIGPEQTVGADLSKLAPCICERKRERKRDRAETKKKRPALVGANLLELFGGVQVR